MFSLQRVFGVSTTFIQVAETADGRGLLGPPDLTYHQYPYRLLFRGNSDHINGFRLGCALVRDLVRNRSELVVIPGYHRIEYWMMLFACMVLKRKRAVFCDSTANENFKTGFKEIAKSFFFRHCHGIFCYGTRSRAYVQSYGVDPRLIHSPCQTAALPHDYDAAAILKRCTNRDRESPIFLFVGRLSEEKGLNDLLAAFRRVHYFLPKAKLILAGPGKESDKLQTQARMWGLEASIQFLGGQSASQIGELLEISTAMVLPSHREPWGLVVNEALSYGCPVVVSDICGCTPELVVHRVTGYVFPAGNVGALCKAMLQVIALSDNRLQTAQRCLEVVSQFTAERAAFEILRGCERILKAS